ncbi:hypothetical protein NESM_000156500 [Novymonas esmeraldas]|uniref:LSM domain-containing protein n=1 Tax=Novymonas esmeraldas TaxID=1808958 RepID=A0AAW0F331_9TRYP
MSATVNFSAGARATNAAPSSSGTAGNGAAANGAASSSTKSKSHMILPYEVLFNLVGRRVTLLLTIGAQELEGTLQSVDSDKGDMLLSDVVRYAWTPSRTPAAAGDTAAEASRSRGGATGETAEDDSFLPCIGGGQRRELSRCQQAMVNSRFVALVTPTLFAPQ